METTLDGHPHDQAMKQFFLEMPAAAARFYAGAAARRLEEGTTFELLQQEQASKILGACAK